MSVDTIPNLTRDKSGKLSADSAAVAALKALPSCGCPWQGAVQQHVPDCPQLVDAIVRLEAKYEAFMYEREGVQRFLGKLAWFFARLPLSIFRLEIAALAGAYRDLVAKQKANDVQASVQSEFYRLREEQRLFRKFVADNFPNDMQRAENKDQPLFELVREILLRGK